MASASPTSGNAPLAVNFDGSGSSDPNAGDTISYSWDLNGDGTFGDSTAQKPSFTYNSAGTYNVVLRVTDNHGASSTSSPVTITVFSGGSSTFGTTTPGSSVDTVTADLKEVSKFTAPSAVNVFKLTGYVSGLGKPSGSQPVRAVIYADSGGNPGALLGVSNAVTITAGRAWGWVDFTFPSAVAVQAGTVWMGYIAGSTTDLTQLRYDPVANDLRYNTNSGGYAAGPSNPFGTATILGLHYSLYASYTTGGGGNNPPVPKIASPKSTLKWKVGDLINFSGSATDPEDGPLPASALGWQVLLHHCYTPTNCHIHYLQTFTGVSSGSFNAPDHSWPSYLELVLTATDSQGASATTSVSLQPKTVDLTFNSNPAGLQLVFDGASQATPYTVTAIIGSTHSMSAPASQDLGVTTYDFSSWSDGGAATHNFTSPAVDASYTATYTASGGSSTFGTTTPGTSTDTASANFKEVSKYSAPQAGNVVKVTGYVSGLGATKGTQKLKAIIYADSGGNPGARLGMSKAVKINANQAWGWVDFTFSKPVAVQAGTTWIGYIGGGKNKLTQLRYDPLAGDQRSNTNSYSSGASNPFGAASILDLHYSIYATYG